MSGQLYLGCPIWACEQWKGSLYTAAAPRASWLGQYSSVFHTVEGNSTFYALPSLDTAKRWADSVQPGFRFALKLPRAISHECRLRGCQRELDAFLAVAGVLHERSCLGPSFLQLPPDFSPHQFSALEEFLRNLPRHMPYAVEVRHEGWFDGQVHERGLDALLAELKIDKVIFDSRPLYAMPPSDDSERAAQTRKPRIPIRTTVTGGHPFLRLIGRNRVADIQSSIDHWAPIIAGWLATGLEPFVFTHAPDDRYAPAFGRALHAAIKSHFEPLPAMPEWPGEATARPTEIQLELF